MASAKKGKKNKGKTLALSDFLQETPGTVATMPIRKSALNWADEVEDSHDMYESRSSKASVVLPTAPKASRDFDDIIDKVPQDPPYIAYLTNLPYDVDENEISAFFRNLKISNMRIPKDERAGEAPRLRGFGYVEFEDRDSLLNALVIPDTTIKNRRIRIEVATDYGNDNRRGGGRMDMNRDRGGNRGGDMSSFGDWRSGPRQDDGGERRGFGRDSGNDGGERRGFGRDSGNDGGERRGFGRDRDRDDSSSGAWRSNREPEKDFSRGPRRFEPDRDRDRGGRNGGGGFTRGPPPARDEEERRDEPRQRPKLMLTPRTKPVEAAAEVEKVAKVASSASIFGNAKPVDTSARERQIEERLARDQREPSRERKERVVEGVGEKEREKEKEKDKEVNGVVVVDKGQHPKRNGDVDNKKETVKTEKPEVRKKEEKKEKVEKEMPKLKKADPPNFIASNKFAYLETEDSSD